MADPDQIANALALVPLLTTSTEQFRFVNAAARAYWLATVQKTAVLCNGVRTAQWNEFLSQLECCVGKSLKMDPRDAAGRFLEVIKPNGDGEPAAEQFEASSPGFVRRGDLLVALTRRATNGVYKSWRPRVIDIVRYACQQLLPSVLVIDFYRQELRRTYEIDDDETFLRYALGWFDAYNQQSEDHLEVEELLGLPVEPPPPGARALWPFAMLELLEFAEVVRPDHNSLQYSLEHRADPSFLFPLLFGVSTGNEGLDYLFYSGLWVPNSRDKSRIESPVNPEDGVSRGDNLSMVISGPPGMGKTTLALSLASTLAARGGLAVYFRFELEETTLRRQLVQFHRRLLPLIETRGSFNADETFTKGVLAFQQLPCGDIDTVQSAVDEVTSAWAESADKKVHSEAGLFSERLVVFDTINAMYAYGRDAGNSRRLLRSLTKQLNDCGFSVVFLVEENQMSFDDHLVDVDIRLSNNSDSSVDDAFRFINIVKSRWQASHRGRHVYHINAEDGFSVYPSSIAVLSSRRRHLGKPSLARSFPTGFAPPSTEKESWVQDHVDPGIASFAKYFGGGVVEDRLKSSENNLVPWWHRGSVTTVVGPRGSFKSSIAFAFALTRDEQSHDRPSPSSLLLRFSEANAISLGNGKLVADAGCSYARITEYPLGQPGRDHKNGALVDVIVRSGHIAPGDVLEVVRRTLRRKRLQQVPIRRAVIQAVGNIEADYPTIYEDRAFIPALREIFAAERITLLLVCSDNLSNVAISDQLLGMAENIIRIGSQERGTDTLTSIWVERSRDATHGRFTCELRKSPGSTRPADIEVVPSFELMDHPRSRQGEPVHVEISLMCDTQLQCDFADRLADRLLDSKGYRVFRQPDRSTNVDLDFDGWHPDPSAEHLLRIRMVDAAIQFPVRDGISRNAESVSLARLPIDAAYRSQLATLSYLHNTPPAPDELFTLPWCGDPSFLVASESFHRFLCDSPEWSNIAAGNGHYTWGHLISALLDYSGKNGEDSPLLFDAKIDTEESVVCLFIEVLVAECLSRDLQPDALAAARHLFSALSGKPLCCNVDLVRRVCESIWHLFEFTDAKDRTEGWDRSVGRDMVRQAANARLAATTAPLSRHWYSSYRQMSSERCNKKPAIDESLKLMRLPQNIWTNGDWHLAISADSISVRAGVRIIVDEFLSQHSVLALLTNGVGLPLNKEVYQRSSDQHLKWFEPYINGENVIVRSAIPCYATGRLVVIKLMDTIKHLQSPDEKDFKRVAEAFAAEITAWCRETA